MEICCRSIAYATLLYWIEVNLDGLTEWDGSLTRIVGGWLAKIVPEGMAINAAEQEPGRRSAGRLSTAPGPRGSSSPSF